MGFLTKKYFQKDCKYDINAAITVAMIAIPQTMAYAIVAGVNPVYGLYSAAIPAMVGALIGSSSLLITGATNATALAAANILSPYSESPDYLNYLFALAISAGLVKLLLGLFKQGKIIRFISNSVLTGFLTGAGMLIILSQLTNILGIPKAAQNGTVFALINLVKNFSLTNGYVVLVGGCSILILRVLKKIKPEIPSALVVIVMASLAVYLLDWNSRGVKIVGDVGAISDFGIRFAVPEIPSSQYGNILIGGVTLGLFTLIESMSVAKAYSEKKGDRMDPSREFAAQGIASIVGGLSSSIPTSGSPSRTAVNFGSGARTRMAGLLSGLIVLLSGFLLGKFIVYIPVASLAGIVMSSAANLIDRKKIRDIWRTRRESQAVFLITLIATLVLDIQIAIYFGVALSVVLYLSGSSHLRISVLDMDDGNVSEHSYDDLRFGMDEYVVLNLEGSLYFAAVDEFEEKVRNVFNLGIPKIILRFRRTDHIGSSGIMALKRLEKEAVKQNIKLFYCGLSPDLIKMFKNSNLGCNGSDKALFERKPVVYSTVREVLRKNVFNKKNEKDETQGD